MREQLYCCCSVYSYLCVLLFVLLEFVLLRRVLKHTFVETERGFMGKRGTKRRTEIQTVCRTSG